MPNRLPESQSEPTGPSYPAVPSSGGTTDALSSAQEVVALLDRYLHDLQAGRNPDREALLAAHPELGTQLEACLAGIDFVHQASDASEQPLQLGDFRLRREVGRGGMGVVYEAEQISLRRRVAVKILRFGLSGDQDAMQRFRHEAETVAALHHTNIVPIIAVGCEDGVHFYAMQFIEGKSLAQRLELAQRDGAAVSSDQVANWRLQAADALAHAHQRGVIHRDVKPSNLILDPDNRLWLTDFGLAKRSDELALTMTGALLGTPRYMSPEQASSTLQPVDERSDVYSLGATLYELLAGQPLFGGDNPFEVIRRILMEEPRTLRSVRPAVPRDLETIIGKCLHKEPGRRYASAHELSEDLRAYRDGRAISARRTSSLERAVRWARRQKKSALIAVTSDVQSRAVDHLSAAHLTDLDGDGTAELVLTAIMLDRDDPDERHVGWLWVLDAKSGQTKWRQPLSPTPSETSPHQYLRSIGSYGEIFRWAYADFDRDQGLDIVTLGFADADYADYELRVYSGKQGELLVSRRLEQPCQVEQSILPPAPVVVSPGSKASPPLVAVLEFGPPAANQGASQRTKSATVSAFRGPGLTPEWSWRTEVDTNCGQMGTNYQPRLEPLVVRVDNRRRGLALMLSGNPPRLVTLDEHGQEIAARELTSRGGRSYWQPIWAIDVDQNGSDEVAFLHQPSDSPLTLTVAPVSGLTAPLWSAPSQQAMQREQSLLLADALAQLSDDYREVITLRNLAGLSHEQVA